MNWTRAACVIGVLIIAIGIWFFASNQAAAPTGPSTDVTETYTITAADSGKTFSYPLTSRFTLELDGTKFPSEDLRVNCVPETTLGSISNIPALQAPLYAVRYETTVPGECTISNRNFSVRVISVNDTSGGGGILPYNSGIRGQVVLGPTCPVERVPPMPGCADRPYATTVSVYRATSTTVYALTQSDTDGMFRFSLPPGDYTIVAAGGSTLPRCAPASVTVGPTGYATTTISCDTGIR